LEFKSGLSFLESLEISIREESQNGNILLEEDKILILKITKDREYRSLEIKIKNKLRREEIEKPNKV
jgi:hypothetical protein